MCECIPKRILFADVGWDALNQQTQKLSELYKRYGFLVKRICREVLWNEEDAEDATHETFLKFWRYTERVHEPREIVALLKRTALSCAIDLLRSRNRRGKYQDALHTVRELLYTERESSKSERQLNRQIVSILFQAVRVDEATLKMVYLYYMDDMTLEEVAKYTGFSRRSVGMKLEKFRENALKYCKNNGISWRV